MTNNNSPIGIFDSGCGGLGILKETIDLLPNENIIYYADTFNAPYGTKSSLEIQQSSQNAVQKLLSYGCKMVVVACNTASVSALAHLRNSFNIPFVGVVPAIKVAAEQTIGKIALLGTKRTLSDEYIEWLADNFANNREIIKLEKNSLVRLIEHASIEKELDLEIAQVKEFVEQQQAESLVLGCTHFPLVKEKFAASLPNVKIIDSDYAVAKQIARVLKNSKIENSSDTKAYRSVIYSGTPNAIPYWLQKTELEEKLNHVKQESQWPQSYSTLHNKKIHIIGVLGTGMSAIAQYLSARGASVSGSDANDNPGIRNALENQGITVSIGHNKDHVANVEWVIHSSAINPKNVEYEQALKRNIPMLSRPDILSLISRWHDTIAVCGSHGKTTITTYLSCLAQKREWHYSSIIGALVNFKERTTNSLNRGEKKLILEADEYDRTFLSVRAKTIVISSIDNDHQEIYPTMADIQKAFKTFVVSQTPYPQTIINISDTGIKAILPTLKALNISTTTISLNENADLTILDLKSIPGGQSFKINYKGMISKNMTFYHPGNHNLINLLLSLGAMFAQDPEFVEIFNDRPQEFIDNIIPPQRRYEILVKKPITLIDDFGHHPAEIEKTFLTAQNQLESNKQLWVVFQPHLYSRTLFFREKLQEILSQAHHTLVLDIYASRESEDNFVSSEILCEKHNNMEFLPKEKIKKRIETLVSDVSEGDTILCIGAGDLFGIPTTIKQYFES